MPVYPFPPAIAIDEPSGGIARNAEGQVYNISDTAFATPLTVTDLAGVALTNLKSSNQGLIPAFRVNATQPRVMWKSGPYVIEILSNDGVLNEISAVKTIAEAANTNASAATVTAGQALDGAMSDAGVAAYVNNTSSQTRAAVVAVATTFGGGSGDAPKSQLAAYRFRTSGGTGAWEPRPSGYKLVIAVGADPSPADQLPGDIREIPV